MIVIAVHILMQPVQNLNAITISVSIDVCGSCYSGSEFPVYEEIETILTKDEYEEILTFNIFIKALGYGSRKVIVEYRAGIKLIDSIKHIYDKLKSDEAFAFFEDIQKKRNGIFKRRIQFIRS